jgi:hypothetical protein
LYGVAWQVEAPVLLVGNKTDQIGDRMVAFEEGQRRSADIDCVSFHEISVRENIDEVRESTFNQPTASPSEF